MRGEWKIYAKQIVIFSLLFAALELVVFAVVSSFAAGQNIGTILTCQVSVELTKDVLSLGFLLMVLYRIAKRLEEVSYPKLIISAIVFLALSYHLEFFFKTIYFYSTHSGGYPDVDIVNASNDNLMRELSKHGLNIFPPYYSMNHYFFYALERLLNSRGTIPYIALIFNPIVLSLWVSGMIWLLTKKKNRNVFKESTLDNG